MTAFQCHWHSSRLQRQMLPHLVIIRARKLQIGGRRRNQRCCFVFFSWLKAYFNLKNARRDLSSSFLLHFHFLSWARSPCGSSTSPIFPGFSVLPWSCSLHRAKAGSWRTSSISSYLSFPAPLLRYLFMQNNLPNSLQTSSQTQLHCQLWLCPCPHCHLRLSRARLLPTHFLTTDICCKVIQDQRMALGRTAFQGSR